MMIKIIALDYDGVVMDSVREIFSTLKRLLEKNNIRIDDSIVDKFKRSRNFLRTAHDLYGIVELVVQGRDLEKVTQKEFDDFMKTHEKESKEFYDDFWETRRIVQDEDYEKWLSLNSLFPDVKDAVERLLKEFHIIIMSSKDFYSISSSLERFGLNIDKDDIFSKDITDNKKEQIRLVTEKYSVKSDEILFIDDQLDNLISLRKLGVNVALAGWGYNNIDQKEETRQAGIPVLMTPSEIEKEIKRLHREGK